jgi:hypothetical protein
MASYKVAQDVEAEDKLLGPFGFRQFIYLIIVAMAGVVGYGLWHLLPPLAILPLPIIVLFGALALPLRKDQPMETYLAAMVSYYLKPRKRLWQPDGIEQIVEITAPKGTEESLTKNFGAGEADRRLSYLADIADSRGWAIRHAAAPTASTSMIGEIYSEAQATEDMLDDSGNLAQNIDSLIDRADAAHRQAVMNRLSHPEQFDTPPAPTPQPQYTPSPQPVQQAQAQMAQQPLTAGPIPVNEPQIDPASIRYNPYPAIHQSVIQPMSVQQAQPQPQPQQQAQAQPVSAPIQPEPAQSTSGTTVSPDIMNLANNSKNLSVETIAHEAKRLSEKKNDGEVVISLR